MSNGGPWGGGNDEDPRDGRRNDGPRRPGEAPPIPEIEEIMKKGSEQLRVLMGGRGGPSGPGGGGRRGGKGAAPAGGGFSRGGVALGLLALVAGWVYLSLYTVRTEERSVELMFGRFVGVGEPGLNFAPWPVVRAELVQLSAERTIDIGTGRMGAQDSGLMLTRDQNIVDIEFQVVWNVADPAKFLFNLADPEGTIRAVAESAMRDIIARSELAPILNRDRGTIGQELKEAVQNTLDSYDAGISVIRINFDRADPPREVIDSFREVQAAQQERDRLEKEADAYANRVLAGARGDAAQLVENAEAYRARVVNEAEGEASRFKAVYDEYVKAPEVTRRRMYLETMEKVLGDVNKVILDDVTGETGGVVPYLPLDQLRPTGTAQKAGGN
ncbi:FtsH protease activity modulator HflK [Phaeovulum vinaykumarii]|uniref:Protein HflK n=1 Tax=Phaeovulum vinaykumarii TaxID=407234 RepID=A0A1N7JKT3_9RHOB|nr:FtsH protease activity modulator HflK [Phaeovulum vinaykumarii]SIS49920.1 protease FtsH subunit HflK [Phaeovulum vinaykumarii]SOB89997.1 protease FtsH subunit HflK [Phaeovulum vinaykumarii]